MQIRSETELIDLFYNKTIALIGNSISFKEENYGEVIDNCDIVCRINKGPLRENSKKNGIRTDILFYSDYNILSDAVLNSLPLHAKLICNKPENDFIFLNWKTYQVTKKQYADIKQTIGYASLNTPKKWPSNGCVSACIILAYNPKNITLFGFDWNISRSFYTKKHRLNSRHLWNLEKDFLFSQEKIQIVEL